MSLGLSSSLKGQSYLDYIEISFEYISHVIQVV